MRKASYRFEKMHGLGNDFMLLDADCQPAGLTLPPDAERIRLWSDRRLGVGFDQLIYLFKKNKLQCYQFYNADGSAAEQCGNGQRAIALYFKNKQVAMPMTIHGVGGQVVLDHKADGRLAITLNQAFHYQQKNLRLPNTEINAYLVDVGNPHCVLISDDVSQEPLAENASRIGALFEAGVNLEVMQIIRDNQVRIRVYERGTGETPACGSGAAAAAIVLRHYFKGQDQVTVSMPGGDLTVLLNNACDKISLIGPAKFVYQGQIYE
ncbi:diaminopimelate epimerase [Marinicella pacifica]|uniref:Diaminopimelate epimerase n=1 Tax=Marinicella pacifica TaxID=1171543 RepID=A0A917FIP1_9GAMM|nr:diaminopimelate epimerase [Marinicella pacifica]GGF87503.1 diaminopimelate epimerase [Marinicella pacifica]